MAMISVVVEYLLSLADKVSLFQNTVSDDVFLIFTDWNVEITPYVVVVIVSRFEIYF